MTCKAKLILPKHLRKQIVFMWSLGTASIQDIPNVLGLITVACSYIFGQILVFFSKRG